MSVRFIQSNQACQMNNEFLDNETSKRVMICSVASDYSHPVHSMYISKRLLWNTSSVASGPLVHTGLSSEADCIMRRCETITWYNISQQSQATLKSMITTKKIPTAFFVWLISYQTITIDQSGVVGSGSHRKAVQRIITTPFRFGVLA